MDPLTIAAVAGGATMLYNAGSYMYNYLYQEESSDIDINEIEREIAKESANEVLEQVEKIKENYDIDYSDVIRELNHLFEYRQDQSDESDSTSESSCSGEFYMSQDSSED